MQSCKSEYINEEKHEKNEKTKKYGARQDVSVGSISWTKVVIRLFLPLKCEDTKIVYRYRWVLRIVMINLLNSTSKFSQCGQHWLRRRYNSGVFINFCFWAISVIARCDVFVLQAQYGIVCIWATVGALVQKARCIVFPLIARTKQEFWCRSKIVLFHKFHKILTYDAVI